MLNIGKLGAGAGEYYVGEVASSAEDYYAGHGESAGRWVGSLAPVLETRTYATVLRDLARRIRAMQTEARTHEKAIVAVIKSRRPDLLDEQGVGPIVAATVLCAWSQPGRCRHEAAFANLAGVAPLEASSGLTTRYRLNRCGDRQLNRALHVIVLSRLRFDAATRAYADRRPAEDKTDREIKRCLIGRVCGSRLLAEEPCVSVDAGRRPRCLAA